jgi:insecticidal toxin complex protein TccC
MVAYCRLDSAAEPEVRVHRTVFDAAGRAVKQWDPRLGADQAPANIGVVYSLSRKVLVSDSVDAGWRLELPGEGGQAVDSWDGRGTIRRMEYDALLRPVVVFENQRCLERLTYGGPDSAEHNQCGQLTRHDDPAGTSLDVEFSLTGNVNEHVRHFLQNLEAPDWPEPVAERDALLEPGDGATTCWTYDPLGEVINQTDALGNLQTSTYTVSGLPKEQRLQLDGQASQTLVGDIRYDAQDRVESETAGNGVVSTARYGAEDGRLLELKAVRSSGEVVQDLAYDYDPVGNVTRIEDRAQPIRYFANQRIEPVSTYQYDTLYQLVEATGRELASVNHGPVFADFQSPPDPAQLANYTQTYRYDAGGNLQQLTHVGSQSHSRTMVTARHSNRSLPVISNQPPSEEDIAAAFDDNGNLLALQAGQVLSWDLRNQLQEVRPAVRESGIDDSERYIYDAGGQRLRKVRTTQAKAVTHIAEVRYLPGLEIRTDTATGETLQVITAQAGRNGVRVLHWQAGKPTEVSNDQVRYSLSDHLGSSSLELDAQAQIISQESYYPFGGTSWWAGRNAVEASYKTVRYSGKERDATGLYYYGLRYYAPWLQRWINPDPAGAVDGLNLFRFVRNSPLRYADREGAAPYDVLSEAETLNRQKMGYRTIARGLEEFTLSHRKAFEEGVSVAASMLKHVIKELRKESPGHGISGALKAAFRDIDDELRQEVIARLIPAFVRQKDFLESLAGEAGHKIDVFTTNINARGLTYPRTLYRPERTIAIASFLLEEHHPLDLAKTLIHEASHASESTSDVYYHGLDILARDSTHEQVVAWTTKVRHTMREVSKRGLDTRHIGLVDLEGFIDTADQSISSDELKQRFLQEPAVRVEVLLENADTYPLFVLSTRLPAKVMAKREEKQARPVGFRRGKEVF